MHSAVCIDALFPYISNSAKETLMTCQPTGVISVSLICVQWSGQAATGRSGRKESGDKAFKIGIEYKCSSPEIFLFPTRKTCGIAERCVSVSPKWYSQHYYGTGYRLWIERGMGHQKGRIAHQRLWAAIMAFNS